MSGLPRDARRSSGARVQTGSTPASSCAMAFVDSDASKTMCSLSSVDEYQHVWYAVSGDTSEVEGVLE